MGFIAKVLDYESEEYDPELQEIIFKDALPDMTVKEMFERIEKVKKVVYAPAKEGEHHD